MAVSLPRTEAASRPPSPEDRISTCRSLRSSQTDEDRRNGSEIRRQDRSHTMDVTVDFGVDWNPRRTVRPSQPSSDIMASTKRWAVGMAGLIVAAGVQACTLASPTYVTSKSENQ